MHLAPVRARIARRFMSLLLATAVAALALPASAAPARATDSVGACGFNGSGTPGDPFHIATPADLTCLKDNSAYWASDFAQDADLDMSGGPAWTHGIGNDATRFTGSYSGGDHSITGLGLVIADAYEGMFGYLDNAAIGALTLSVAIVQPPSEDGFNWVGGLAGYMAGGSYIADTIVTSNIGTTGALAASAIGGVVGGMDDVVPSYLSNVHATSSITLNGLSAGHSDGIGGLVGYAYAGTIMDSSAGGFIDLHTAQATASSFVDVMNVGGLVGTGTNLTMSNVSADMQITLQVTGASGYRAHVDALGGLIGSIVGGLITDAVVTGSAGVYTTGYADDAGGLAGFASDTTVTRAKAAFALDLTSATDSSNYVGGLVGTANGGMYTAVGADASIHLTEAVAGQEVGGLFGHTGSGGAGAFSLFDGYATGWIRQSGMAKVGGLIGYSVGGTIYNSYAAVGYPADPATGGLIGSNDGGNPLGVAPTACFDVDTSGTSTAAGDTATAHIVALGTAALKEHATFAIGGTGPGGDFTSAWAITDGWTAPGGSSTWGICAGANNGFPYLLWEHATNPCVRTLTVEPLANGSVTASPAGINCPAGDCTATYVYNAAVTLTATPDSGYYLASWTGACSVLTTTCDLSMDVDRTVGATFLPIELPVITTAPAATLRTGVAVPSASVASAIPVTVTWGASAGSSATTGYTLEVSKNGGAYTFVAEVAAPATSTSTTVPSAGTFRFRVTAHSAYGDSATLAGATRSARLVQQSATTVKYAGTWTAASSTAFSGGSLKWSKTARSSATFTFPGSQLALVVDRAALRGKVTISVDGAKAVLVDLKGTTAHRYIAWRWSGASKTHTVKVTVLATAGRPRIDLDAFVTLK